MTILEGSEFRSFSEQYVTYLIENFYQLYERRYYGNENAIVSLLDLQSAIREADLSEKQVQMVRCVMLGYTQREIASLLELTQPTVSHHLNNAVRKIARTMYKKRRNSP